MTRKSFIIKLYSKFILEFIVKSFVVFYMLGYVSVLGVSYINKGEFYNPLLTDITKKSIPKREYSVLRKKGNDKHYQIIKIKEEEYKNIQANDLKYIEFNNVRLNIGSVFAENSKEMIEKVEFTAKSTKEKINRHLMLIFDVYTDIILMIIFVISLIYYVYKKSRYNRYYLLPYDLNIFQNFGSEDKQKKVYDKFQKLTKKGEIIFKNKIKSSKEKFDKEQENIKQLLGYESLEIERYGKNGVLLKTTELIKSFLFDKSKIKDGKIYIGMEKGNKDKYLDIEGLAHTILIGESGSGKSVFVQNLLISFFKSREKFEKFIMVDPKMVELSRYKKYKKVEYIEEMKDVLEMLRNLEKTMFSRLSEMEKLEETKSKDPFILLLVDEFATLKMNSLDSKENQELEKILINLGQKRRAANIRILLRGQKRDTQNLSSNVLGNMQTRICLKTKSSDNILKIRGSNEELEDLNMTSSDIRNFNKGRGIFRDGDSGEVILFQSPFFDIEDEKNKSYMNSLLELKEEYKTKEKEEEKEPVKIEENLTTDTKTLSDKKECKISEEKVSITTENNLTSFQLEQQRKEYWEKSKSLETEKGSEIRKQLFQVKKLIAKNQLKESQEILTNILKKLK